MFLVLSVGQQQKVDVICSLIIYGNGYGAHDFVFVAENVYRNLSFKFRNRIYRNRIIYACHIDLVELWSVL